MTAPRAGASASQSRLTELSNQNAELKVTIDQVEKEREFYFNKLREIELCVQNTLDNEAEAGINSTLKEIQTIMYKTEDGFEAPVDETETF